MRAPKLFCHQLEVLEDRTVPSAGEWLLRLDGLSGSTPDEQIQAAQKLIDDAGIAGVQVVDHATIDGNVVIESDTSAPLVVLNDELSVLPGFVAVQPFVGEDDGGAATPAPDGADPLTLPAGPADDAGTNVNVGLVGNEPTVAVNPLNPNNVVVAQFNNGAQTMKISLDGGATFPITRNGVLVSGQTFFQGDDSLAFDSHGRLFWSYLSGGSPSGPNVNVVQINPATGAVVGSAQLVATSSLDKEWIAADSNSSSPYADNIYVVWQDFNQVNAPVRFARSTDHGATWTTLPGNLSGANEGFTWPADVSVGPNGDVWVAWHANTGDTSGEVLMRRSTDGGLTFGPEIVPFPAGTAATTTNGDSGLANKLNGLHMWLQGSMQPVVLTDPARPGNIYVVSVDDPDDFNVSNDPSDVVLARSTDYGATWTRSTISQGKYGDAEIMPAAAIDPNGDIAVTFYTDVRHLTVPDSLGGTHYLLDLYRIVSLDGGLTFSPPAQVNDPSNPFDPELGAPDRFGNHTLRIGEYNGVAIANGTAYAVWTGNSANGQQIQFDKFTIGFQVASSTPAQNAIVQTPPVDFTVQLNGPVNPATVQAGDLTVNGVPADSFTINPAGTAITFHYNSSPVVSQGLQSMAMAADSVESSTGSPILAFSATFRYDAVPLVVTSTNPPFPGGIFTLPGPFAYDVNFSEPVKESSVQASDLVLSGVPGATVTGVTLLNGDTTARFTIAGVAAEGALTASIAAGAVTDVYDNPGTAFSATYQVDIGTVPYPVPLAAKNPPGSLIYDPSVSATVNFAGDTDSFTINLDPGQTLTALADPAGSPDPTLYGGVGNGAGSAAGELLLIDPATAASTVVGDPVTPGGLTGLVFDPSANVFLGSTINGGVSALVRINPDTGALISTVGTITNGPGGPTLSIGDLAIQPGTNTLYGITSNAGGTGGLLYTINKNTGVATFVGATGSGAGGGIAFAPDGSLYQTAFNSGFDFTSLNKIDPNTAARISTVAISGYFDGLAIRPSDGAFFAAQGGSGTAIYTINPTTGATTLVGYTSASTSDLAFRPSTALAPTLELRDPSGHLVASASAGTGLNALLQTVPVTAGGTYTVTVGGSGGSSGGYTLRLILNAALEAEGAVAGASDDSRASAQDLEPSFVTLQTPQASAQRGAVEGQFNANDDFYSFHLDAGHSATVGMSLSNASTALFGPRADVSGFSGPLAVAYGDLNGDGKADMVVASYSGSISVALGNGDGTFGNPSTYYLGSYGTWSVALGDFNGDGKLDVVASNVSSNTISVLLGNGAGGFGSLATYFVGYSPYGVATGDLNGDGYTDVVVANQYSNTVSVFYGQATGVLTGRTDYQVSLSFFAYPTAVALGDVDGDGKLDVVTANSNGTISVLLNNGAGGLGSPALFSTGSSPYSLALGDVNGDGKLDVVTSSAASGTVSVLLGDGAGGFGGHADYSTGDSYSYRVALGDLNGDGLPDIAVANTGGSSVGVLLNKGDGTFSAPITLATGGSYDYGVTLADLNGDGLLDLSTANYSGGNVSVWLNATTRVQLQLQDAAGNVLATGIPAANLDAVISNFVAPASGTYYVRVFGVGSASYNLVVTRDAAFDTEPNSSFATAQSIDGVQGVLGGLSNSELSTVTLNWTDSGWWINTGDHNAGNKNYLAGQDYGFEFRNYFVFDLSGITLPITGATLRIYNPGAAADGSDGYVSSDPSETYSLFDVSTPVAALEATNSGQTAIFNDLGTGTSFGSQSVSAADDGKVVSINLNSDGVAALNAARGGLTALGGAITTISGSAAQAVFEYSNSPSLVRQLVLSLGQPEDWYSVNVASTANALRLETSTPGGGPGEFGNILNPKIELYDPSGNLVASGTPMADGRNEFIQYTPLVTGNYRVRVVGEGGSLGEYFLTKNFLPVVTALSVNSPINENGTATVSGTISDPDPFDRHTVVVTWGPGEGSTTLTLAAGVTSFTASHQYLDDNPSGTPSDSYPIFATVTDNHGGSGTGSTSVTVNNVPPVVGPISGLLLGVRGQTLTFSSSFSDVGTLDTHTVTWNFGDGTGDFGPTAASPGAVSMEHVFTASGTYTVTLTVRDDDGGVTTVTNQVQVVAAALEADPLNPGQKMLVIGGTTGNDEIQVDRVRQTSYQVEIDSEGCPQSEWEGTFAGSVSRIVAYGQAGDDDIQVAGDIAVSAWLYGGDGNDRLKGGAGANVLVGGDGNDQLVGGSGRDVLIGGRGADRIVGNAGDDILIAGYTAYDDPTQANQAKLFQILGIWTSGDTYANRVAALQASLLRGEGDPSQVTVFDDGAADILTGSSGQDWFLLQLDGPNKDKVTDLSSSEFASDLDFIGSLYVG